MNFILLEAAAGGDVFLTQLVVMVAMFALLYFFFLRPQKKKDKEVQLMRAKLEVGDEVLTRGGILGRVVSLKDDTVLIETSGDRTKIRVARWAIENNNSAAERK